MSTTRQIAKQDAAVFRLPIELLLEAFKWGLSAQWTTLRSPWEKQTIRYLKSITAVCSHWRQVAISDSLLWRRLSIANHATESYDGISHRLRTFLARSTKVTLDIYIYIPTRDNASDSLARLADIPLRHIQRCRALEVVYRASAMPFVIKPASGPLTNLIDLRIQIELWQYAGLSLTVLSPNNMAPLQSLDLQFDRPDGIQKLNGLENLRTERLRRLSITCNRDDWFSDLMGFVSHCTNVESLSLAIAFPEESAHIEPFELTKVKEFSDASFSQPFALCRIISMPALEMLKIQATRIWSGRIHVIGLTLPRLRSLTLELWWFGDNDLLFLYQLFRANPSIEEIRSVRCYNHCVVLFAILGTINEDEIEVTEIPPLDLDPLDLVYGPKESSKRVLPALKRLCLFHQVVWPDTLPENLSYFFCHVLLRCESAHIEVHGWGSYGGAKGDTEFLEEEFGDRFSFLGEYPDVTEVVSNGTESDAESHTESDSDSAESDSDEEVEE